MLFTKFGVPTQNKLPWFFLGAITVKNFAVSLIDIIFYRESRSTDPLFDLFNKLIPLKLE